MLLFSQRAIKFLNNHDPKKFEFTSVKELLQRQCVKQWSQQPHFRRFVKAKFVENDYLLIAEFGRGKAFHIVGVIKGRDVDGILWNIPTIEPDFKEASV